MRNKRFQRHTHERRQALFMMQFFLCCKGRGSSFFCAESRGFIHAHHQRTSIGSWLAILSQSQKRGTL